MNLPNKLTLLRICLVPLCVACFYLPAPYGRLCAAVVFLLAYMTDICDGYIARKQNIVTNFGKLMDPIADKLLTGSAFIMLAAKGWISPIATIIVIAREFLISGIRLVAVNGGKVIAASWLGKIKTVMQCAAVVAALIWPYVGGEGAHLLANILLWASVVFTIWSGADYILKNKGTISYK